MERSRFPNKLKSFRRTAGYSRKAVARITLGHTDPSMVSRWESGHFLPGLIQAMQLAKLYGVYPHELFEELWHNVGEGEYLLASDKPFNSNQ